MNAQNNQNKINVGVDTGKQQLDIYIRPLDIYFTVTNDEKGINKAIKEIKKHKTTRIVIEATGLFKTEKLSNKHIIAGAKKVVLTAPPIDDSIKTIVIGVNDHLINANDKIISNASCTTNNAAPMIKVIDEHFTIESVYITTIHSFTSDQRLHDSPHKDFRRARSATSSIVPTTTGAAKAVTKVFPHLKEIIGGCGMRVPVANGSLTDITFVIREETTIEKINTLFINVNL